MQVIAIDVGRSGVKVVSGDNEKYFSSKVGDSREMDIGEHGGYVVTVVKNILLVICPWNLIPNEKWPQNRRCTTKVKYYSPLA